MSRSLDRSLMPWIIASQTIPILAIAPMIIVVLNAAHRRHRASLPKALISTYLSLLPGHGRHGEGPALARSDPARPDAHLSTPARWQTFWKLRWPASVPFLFASMKVGDRREPRRRHRRRAADRRRRRPRRAAAHRLLLRPDRADLGGADRRLAAGRACSSPSSALAKRIVLGRMGVDARMSPAGAIPGRRWRRRSSPRSPRSPCRCSRRGRAGLTCWPRHAGSLVALSSCLTALFATEPAPPGEGVGMLFIGVLAGAVFALLMLHRWPRSRRPPIGTSAASLCRRRVSGPCDRFRLLGWLLVGRLAAARRHDPIAAGW